MPAIPHSEQPYSLSAILRGERAKRIAKHSNVKTFVRASTTAALTSVLAEYQKAQEAQETMKKTKPDALEVSDEAITYNGTVIRRDMTAADIRKSMPMPDSQEDKISLMVKFIQIGDFAILVAGVIYVDIVNKDPSVDAYIIGRCNATHANLQTLYGIGTGKVHPKFYMVESPLYRRLITQQAPMETQNAVANAAAITVPKIITVGRSKEVVFEKKPTTQVTEFQAQCVVVNGHLVKDNKVAAARALELDKARTIKAQSAWTINAKQQTLNVGRLEMDVARFERMALDFYRKLKDTAATKFFEDREEARRITSLQESLKQNQIKPKST